jgi:hypothetical protein
MLFYIIFVVYKLPLSFKKAAGFDFVLFSIGSYNCILSLAIDIFKLAIPFRDYSRARELTG